MSGYLTQAQVDKLLAPILPSRVSTDGKGFSHVEAYEIRATLNRLFGFARWSEEVVEQRMVFEDRSEKKRKDGSTFPVWTVLYTSRVKLTVCAPDGTVLAVYTEGATGEGENQPSRGDAHDLALKTSQSQALKRCAANLGDVAGLSLYKKGSRAALVRMTLHYPFGDRPAAPVAVDAHVTETPPEDQAPEPPADLSTSTPPPVPDPPAETRSEPADDKAVALYRLRGQALAEPQGRPQVHFMRLQMEATKAGVLNALTTDEDGQPVTFKALCTARLQHYAKAKAS
jgi:hypothetical protein